MYSHGFISTFTHLQNKSVRYCSHLLVLLPTLQQHAANNTRQEKGHFSKVKLKIQQIRCTDHIASILFCQQKPLIQSTQAPNWTRTQRKDWPYCLWCSPSRCRQTRDGSWNHRGHFCQTFSLRHISNAAPDLLLQGKHHPRLLETQNESANKIRYMYRIYI